MKNDAFSELHPLCSISFFFAVISLSMLIRHPSVAIISFVFATMYSIVLDARKSLRFLLLFCLPVFVLTALINPAFNHQGTILLFRLPTGNYVTFESFLYGAFAAVMLSAILMWFFAFSSVMTSDKFVWLAGRLIPSLGLLLSMILRFVPEFIRRFSRVRAVDNLVAKKGPISSVTSAFRQFSSVISWSLESAVTTADSMKCRGYGSGKRSFYSNYYFRSDDLISLAVTVVGFLSVLVSWLAGSFDWRFFPSVKGSLLDSDSLPFFGVFIALCLTPIVVDLREKMKCRSLR